jgi:hypothetical protein
VDNYDRVVGNPFEKLTAQRRILKQCHEMNLDGQQTPMGLAVTRVGVYLYGLATIAAGILDLI